MTIDPIRLTIGLDVEPPDKLYEEERVSSLRVTVEKYLPELVVQVKKEARKLSKTKDIAIHQDAFAFDYNEDEYKLLGMFVKYAGLYQVAVHITGKNKETVSSK